MRKLLLLPAILFSSACATHPAHQSAAAERLETTPRHNEWVQLHNGARVVSAYVAYPETAMKAPAVLIIHENRGLSEWERSVADRLAQNGYLAIAPNLLSGLSPANADAAREAISKLSAEQVMSDLDAAADAITRDPAANGKLFVAGFCWGGGRAWSFANHRRGIAGAMVFYGSGPQDPAGAANVEAPVFGFYGGADARIDMTVPKTQELMTAAGKRFEPVTYEGAGHAFMRIGEAADATAANRNAHDQAWTRWLATMSELQH